MDLFAHLHVLSGVDRAVVTAGVFMAFASASFATYMVSTNHPHPMFNGIEHLMLFAQPNRGAPFPIIARVPEPSDGPGIDFAATGTIPGKSGPPVTPPYTLPAANELAAPSANRGVALPIIARVPETSDNSGIDFTPTGAIPGKSGPSAPLAEALPAPRELDGPIIKDFILRGVSGNVAMVEGADGIYRIEPGATLPGAGRMLAIQWRKGKFVVVTTRGIISEKQP